MTQTVSRPLLLSAGLFSWIFAGAATVARADPPPPAGSGPGCVLSGTATVPKDSPIFSAPSAGNRIALFSGAASLLRANNFPTDASTGRMQVNTGGGFRIEGFMDPRVASVVAVRDLPVIAGRVWISAGRQLRVLGATAGQLRVELGAGGALSAPVQATALCDAFSYGRAPSPVFEVPGQARGFVAQRGELELFGSAAGDLAYVIHASGQGNGLLLWGQEVRGSYVHVISRFELFVDGWVRRGDVSPLPRGEMMDQALPPEQVQNSPTLAVQNYQVIIQAPRNVTLRYGRGDNQPSIGEIEAGTEVYVMDVVLGWASVIPKALNVLPPDDRAFWAKATDLGLAAPSRAPDAGAGKK
jgi:hypothetical protein